MLVSFSSGLEERNFSSVSCLCSVNRGGTELQLKEIHRYQGHINAIYVAGQSAAGPTSLESCAASRREDRFNGVSSVVKQK